MVECYQPAKVVKAPMLKIGVVASVVALVAVRLSWPSEDVAFVAAQRWAQAIPSRVALKADKDIVDAEVVGEEDDDDVQVEEVMQRDLANSGYLDYVEERQAQWPKNKKFSDEAKRDYSWNEDPPESWFERQKIDRYKVANVFFDQFKKPKEWFPYDLQPGDTVRVSYLESKTRGNDDGRFFGIPRPTRQDMREQNFEGVVLDFKGQYHLLEMVVRGMQNKGNLAVGTEWTFPLHSPLVTKLQVLKRGYIGQNKNAYFIRGMVGLKNIIPIDKDRTKRDQLHNEYRLKKKMDLLPMSQYPTEEMYRFPQAVSVQDMPEWDESTYDATNVDQRSWYEKELIGNFRRRPKQELRGKRHKPPHQYWHGSGG